MSEFWQNLKRVIIPVSVVVGTVGGILVTVFIFAADSWVRGIVEEEIGGDQTTQSEHATKLTVHEGKLEQHDEEIEDNEDEINRNDERFTDFVREILSR